MEKIESEILIAKIKKVLKIHSPSWHYEYGIEYGTRNPFPFRYDYMKWCVERGLDYRKHHSIEEHDPCLHSKLIGQLAADGMLERIQGGMKNGRL